MRIDWQGVFTALITPFKENSELDENGLALLVRRQLEAGVHGLVPCGTTGESPALADEEWEKVITITVREAKGRAWIIAGSGTNNTTISMARTRRAKEIGTDGALIITPYYNKPTPDGLVRHFRLVSEAALQFPLMVYNVPGRTGLNLTPETLQRLVELPSVSAVKEASGNLMQIWTVVKTVGNEIAVFSGDDGLNLPIWEIGGVGTVSVLSNVAPQLTVQWWNAHKNGERNRAYELHCRLAPLCKSLFLETSPAPVKFALRELGLPAGEVRPPLAPLRKESRQLIRHDLKELKLL